MRRVLSRTAAPVALSTAVRGVYSTWGSVILEEPIAHNKTWLERITSQSAYRSFAFQHIVEAPAPAGTEFAPAEQYLYSALLDDVKRLMSVDWTVEFDPFWRDRVLQHQELFDILYKPGRGLSKLLFGNASDNVKGRLANERELNRLKAILQCAEETEKRYSAMSNARFHMQREVFDALEREKILAACVEIVEEFKATVPAEFARKAVGELDNHLMTMRHWVWDCPNAKRTYPRRLA